MTSIEINSVNLPPLPDSFGNPLMRDINEIVAPAHIDWLPQTIGWYVIGALGVAAVIRWSWRVFKQWLRNRYRREALHRLNALAAEQAATPASINELLKTAAIIASSRREVAALTGDAWSEWLAQRISNPVAITQLTEAVGAALYRGASSPAADDAQLLEQAQTWIREHRDDHGPT